MVSSSDRENMEIAKKASWMHELFMENNLTLEDKQEILRRLAKKLKKEELATLATK